MAILEADKIYLFSQFTEFSQPPDEILAELGYDWGDAVDTFTASRCF